MKSSTKLNDGCLKIFKLIDLLYKDEADYKKVIEIFNDGIDQSTNNTQVILNKYINTLKIFGIKIKKRNHQFTLENSLYSMPFSSDDLKSINILSKSINNFPDNEITKNLEDFLKLLMQRMNLNDKNKLNSLKKDCDFSFFYSDLKEKIKHCQQICQDKYVTEVFYIHNSQDVRCKCTPKEILYEPQEVYLQIYDIVKRENIDIPISNILAIAKQPQIANSTELTTTVVYKLKNRLAKTYKIKENEYSDGYDKNGNLTIINKNEPFDKLLKRLMRYSYNCEIISPKSLRNEMSKLINETLSLYDCH